MPRSIRDIAIALLLLGGGLLVLLSSQKSGATGPLTKALYTIARPFQSAASWVHSGVTYYHRTYVSLIGVQQENQALKKEISRLRYQQTILQETEQENRRLKKLLDLKKRHEFPLLAARVIGEDGLGWYRTFFIDRGTDDGVRENLPVIVAHGVAGRVLKCAARMSQVLMITDPNLSIDCRTVRTRDRGILAGSLEQKCVLRYINLKSEMRPGDKVITSGLDGVFPRGLAVGTVEAVRHGRRGLFLEARVEPAVDFKAMEEVMVILGQQGGFDIRTGLERKP